MAKAKLLRTDSSGDHPILREQVYLPGTVVETMTVDTKSRETADNVFDLLRPQFDVLWNASGFARSIFFDDEGNPRHSEF